jgi:hypothetical protein
MLSGLQTEIDTHPELTGASKQIKIARVVITNATIGGKIDNETEILDSELEYVVMTENKFHDLATSYKAAGLIGA